MTMSENKTKRWPRTTLNLDYKTESTLETRQCCAFCGSVVYHWLLKSVETFNAVLCPQQMIIFDNALVQKRLKYAAGHEKMILFNPPPLTQTQPSYLHYHPGHHLAQLYQFMPYSSIIFVHLICMQF